MERTFGWAVLGPGGIANRFAGQLPRSEHGRLVAVGSSDPDRARAFADTHGAEFTGDYAQVLAMPEVDGVYISTVHTTHAELAIAALRAGKHVLCEKPMAPHSATVEAMVAAARESGKVLAEAYMYRHHPQMERLLAEVAAGTIGDLVHVDASFSFHTGATTGRLLDPELAGGGILDVGGYPLSFARAVVGAAQGGGVVEPLSLRARGTTEGGVDTWTVAQLEFPDDVTATIRTGIRHSDPSTAVVHGSRGTLTLSSPWLPGAEDTLTIRVVGSDPVEVPAGDVAMYAREADAVARAAAAGETEVASLPLADSLGNARALQRWRDAVGEPYPFERLEADVPTVDRAPLRRSPSAAIPTAEIPGVGTASRLVMGCDNQTDLTQASVMFDAFFTAGGTTFDTAHIYGGGRHETLLGRWIANRGVRDEVRVIAKGAHTPHCTPEAIGRQLEISLDRLGIETADLYMMHRDDRAVPVGEFVDAMDEQVRAGRIRAFGGSNWLPERIDAADEYAREHGRATMAALSNHFGLAEALDVPWAGCEHVTDAASRAWLTEKQIPLLPWSSQARGFFAGRADPEDRSDAELVRCYYSDENFERLRRARHIAQEQGVHPTAVALAYVLAQPFPTFPLFGPRTLTELHSSLEALAVTLTPEQVAWLDLQQD